MTHSRRPRPSRRRARTSLHRAPRGMPQRTIAKQRRRKPVAAAKRAREVRARVAHQPPHVADRDRPLLAQQLRGDRHPPRVQVLVEGVAELRVRALQLPGRGRQRPRDRRERQRAAIVTRDDHPRQQIQPAAFAERIGVHTPPTDPPRAPGQAWSQRGGRQRGAQAAGAGPSGARRKGATPRPAPAPPRTPPGAPRCARPASSASCPPSVWPRAFSCA
jgi:hypothetical protein